MFNNKIYKYFSLVLFLTLVIVGCSKTDKYSYEEIGYQKFQQKVNYKENFYIIFERDDCPFCPEFLDMFSDFAQNNNISFFVLNTKELTQKQKDYCRREYNLEYVPTVIFFEKGEKENILVGTDNADEINKFQKSHLEH